MRVLQVGIDTQGQRVVLDGLVDLPQHEKGVAEVDMEVGQIRSDAQGLSVMKERGLVIALLSVRRSQVDVRRVVVLRYPQRVTEQRYGVTPVAYLEPRARREHRDYYAGCYWKNEGA